ncbi:MAG: hypothetical protein V4639_19085 [Pseudomonadota bacterium]|uniref:hypothetical protein n=1 Tax=unclassified Polaromonas TaxID=2638319 RepID=UPI0025E67456|nr:MULTISPECIES: hypothetical protein [unclassified Polaromonas]MDP2449072.1 hypothetical protein [Polaromonas sp.]HQR96981.1 hypothetical protein [Polaromonas sp.]HQS39114.1 hypothetical protein [Polaromonas sp.]
MPHEFRNLPNVSHETLTTALVASAVAALMIFALISYLLWRDRKKFKAGKAARGHPRRVRRKRPR